ncbi:MAG: tail fiber domain-containing protein [Chitinophagaceae bacterium]|nr:tail fiber domain-containing protein [Chitinophagaceae bacterium]
MDSVSNSTAIGTQAGYNNRGNENTFLGLNSGFGASGTNLTGIENTGLGTATLAYTNTGRANTAVGLGALYANRTGSNNTAIGVRAMVNSQAASRNVAIGDSTLYSNTVNELVAIGHFAMRDNISGVDNVAVGAFAMEANTTGDENTAVGANALQLNTTGGFNTAIGANTLYYQTAATGNTAIGSNTLPSVTTGGYNTALGINVLFYDTTGTQNVGIGHFALFENRNGNGNIAIGGSRAMKENRSGNYNIAIGRTALNYNLDGDYNIAIGDSALANTTNTATGGNLAIGREAGNTNIAGTFNSLIGYGSDVVSAALTNATALGYLAQAGQSNSITLGSINGVNGALTTVNAGIGTNTPNARLHVQRNGAGGGLYHGSSAMIIEDNANSYVQFSHPNANETGFLSGNTSNFIRSAFIFRADSSLQFRSGGNTTRMTVDNNGNIGIGTITPLTKTHIHETTNANADLRISSVNSTYEPGVELVKTGAGGSDWKLRVTSAGVLVYSRSVDDFVTPTDQYEMGVLNFMPAADNTKSLGGITNRWTTVYATNGTINTSDARDKENISDLNYGLKEIMQLRPVSFNWKEKPQWGKKIGFVAQEVKPILREVVQEGDLKGKTEEKDDHGNAIKSTSDKLGIYYSDIIPVTVKAIQEQQQLILKQQKTIDELVERIKKLENKQD